MKKIYIIICLVAVIGVFLCVINNDGKSIAEQTGNAVTANEKNEVVTDEFDDNTLSLKDLSQLESVSIFGNEDPGGNPSADAMGVLGILEYPFKNIEISDNDEVLIVIRPTDALKNENIEEYKDIYAYVACDAKKTQLSKKDFCYFKVSKGTTPMFYVSIYRNGDVISENIGVFAVHLAHLKNEFKAINSSVKFQGNEYIITI